MKENEVPYCVLIVCVTAMLITIGYLSSKTDEKRINLFVECLYASQGIVDDPVEKCRIEIPRIIRWEEDLEGELDEPEDLMDGGK